MSRPVQIVCDGARCQKVKGASNHWWIVGTSQYALFITSEADFTFDERYGVLDFCGRECALKFISEYMGKSAEPTHTGEPGDGR